MAPSPPIGSGESRDDKERQGMRGSYSAGDIYALILTPLIILAVQLFAQQRLALWEIVSSVCLASSAEARSCGGGVVGLSESQIPRFLATFAATRVEGKDRLTAIRVRR